MSRLKYERVNVADRPTFLLNQLAATKAPEASGWNPAMVLFGRVSGRQGDRGDVHVHEGAVEYLYTIEGEAMIRIGGHDVSCKAGQLLIIAPDTEHPVHVTGQTWVAVSSVVACSERVS